MKVKVTQQNIGLCLAIAFIVIITGIIALAPKSAVSAPVVDRITNTGYATVTTNASGIATISHGLDVAVRNVFLTPVAPPNLATLQWRAAAINRRTVEFLAVARKPNGSVHANAAISFSWMAEGCLPSDTEVQCQIPTPTPSPSESPSESPTPPPSPTPSTSPSPTMSPTPSPTPTQPPNTGFPGPNNTGIPTGTTLTTYTGPCTITVPNTVIDAKQVNCLLSVQTTGVIITRSKLLGVNGSGFRVEDSTIDISPNTTQGVIADGLNGDNFVALRVEIFGSNRGVYCHRNSTIQDSWIHGTEINPTSDWHASALRVEQGCNVIHNTLACDWLIPTPADGGCSADLTGYPDFAPIKDNLIQNNLFVANPTGAAFCAYGGASPGKPYSNDPTNATNIRFIDNVFQRGSNRNCAAYGPIDSFAVGRPGNVWTGNVWDDGGTVNP